MRTNRSGVFFSTFKHSSKEWKKSRRISRLFSHARRGAFALQKTYIDTPKAVSTPAAEVILCGRRRTTLRYSNNIIHCATACPADSTRIHDDVFVGSRPTEAGGIYTHGQSTDGRGSEYIIYVLYYIVHARSVLRLAV